MDQASEMTSADLIDLLRWLKEASIEVWLDGGWGVDALLDTQTREHKDAVVFDVCGNGVYRMENGEDWIYPDEGFGGRGSVDGVVVQCLSPTSQVLCHAHGYTPVEKDFRDMELLHKRFGVELPPQLKRTPV